MPVARHPEPVVRLRLRLVAQPHQQRPAGQDQAGLAGLAGRAVAAAARREPGSITPA